MLITIVFTVCSRHAGVFEFSVRSFCSKLHTEEGVAVFLSHDLSMLRLVETFSESCPQLVLMLTIILQRNQLDFVTGAVSYSCLDIESCRFQADLSPGQNRCSQR